VSDSRNRLVKPRLIAMRRLMSSSYFAKIIISLCANFDFVIQSTISFIASLAKWPLASRYALLIRRIFPRAFSNTF